MVKATRVIMLATHDENSSGRHEEIERSCLIRRGGKKRLEASTAG
jgi:hypothetical protein